MNKSDQIELLCSSLSKFQGEIQNAFKGKKGYGYNYADLASILDDVRPILCRHGLSVVQLAGNAGSDVSVETVLMHDSGQFISETIQMPVDIGKGMSRAQAIGSVISYARRYSLTSCLGIAQTDNDAAIKNDDEPVQRLQPKMSAHQKLSQELLRNRVPKERVRAALDAMYIKEFLDCPESRFDELMGFVMGDDYQRQG